MAKKKALKHIINEGDIVVLSNGRVFRAREANFVSDCSSIPIIWMDADEESFISDTNSLHIESILKPTPDVLLTFNATRSLHERLNRLSKV